MQIQVGLSPSCSCAGSAEDRMQEAAGQEGPLCPTHPCLGREAAVCRLPGVWGAGDVVPMRCWSPATLLLGVRWWHAQRGVAGHLLTKGLPDPRGPYSLG